MEDEAYVVYSDAECLQCSAPLIFLKAESGEVVLLCEECQGVYLNPDAVSMDVPPHTLTGDGVVTGTQVRVQRRAFAQPAEIAGTSWDTRHMIGDRVTLAEYEEDAKKR